MSNLEQAFQPAIDALEKEFAELQTKANALLSSINLLRERAGLPPRPGGTFAASGDGAASASAGATVKLHSDSFTGKKLQSAVRQYLEMRKASGGDAPATSREIFDALREGGFSSGAKDDATALVVLRTMLRKSNVVFVKLQNGKYGLRAWYPNYKAPKEGTAKEATGEASGDGDEEEAPKGKAAA